MIIRTPAALTASLLAALLFICTSAYAEYRLATVDINKVLNESAEAKEKRKELDKKSAEAKRKVDERGEGLKSLEKKIQDGEIAQNSKEAEKFRQEAKEFSRYVKDTEDELRNEFMKVNKTLTQKVVKQVENYAKKNKIDLVLDKSQSPRGAILFGSETFDITQDILKEING